MQISPFERDTSTNNTSENHCRIQNNLLSRDRENVFKNNITELRDILQHYNYSNDKKNFDYNNENHINSVNLSPALLAYNPLCISTAPTFPSPRQLDNDSDFKISTPLNVITPNSSQSTSTEKTFNSKFSNDQQLLSMDSSCTSLLTPISSTSLSKDDSLETDIDKYFNLLTFATPLILPQSSSARLYSKFFNKKSFENVEDTNILSTTKYVIIFYLI